MHRRFLAFVVAALSFAVVMSAVPEIAHAKPSRGPQGEAKQVRVQKVIKPRAKASKRSVKRAKRAIKQVRRSAKRRDVTRARRASVRHAKRGGRVRATVVRANVARPVDPTPDDRFYYGPIAANGRQLEAPTARHPVMAGERTTESGSGWSDIVAEARRHIGTNPTGRSNLWCARFMNFVLERAGHRGTGSDMAQSFARYGRRVSGPQVGAIAVMSRGRRGGHVGLVSGIDANGNPIIISGNHRNRVAEVTYPRGRIRAYVMPGS